MRGKYFALLIFITFISIIILYGKHPCIKPTKNQPVKHLNNNTLLPSFQPFVNNFRIASDYKLSVCLIEKSMSSVLASIICLLHAKMDYLKANGTVLCGGWHCNYGNRTINEYKLLEEMVIKTNTHLTEWKLFTIVRDPIERFLSGFVHQCVNKNKKCYNCNKNLTCVLQNISKRAQLYLKRSHGYLTSDDRHFFPQNWRCQFQHFFKYYQIIKYEPYQSKNFNEMLNQITEIFDQQKVPTTISNFIIDNLKQNLTKHATLNSLERQKYAFELKNNRIAQKIFMKIFFYDFLLFNFTIPQYLL